MDATQSCSVFALWQNNQNLQFVLKNSKSDIPAVAEFCKNIVIPVSVNLSNAVFNLLVMLFTGYVVFGASDRICSLKNEMQMVKQLWVASIATDVLAPLPLAYAVRNEPIKFGLDENDIIISGCFVLLIGLLLFMFVDSLNDVVQAGGTGYEGLPLEEIVGKGEGSSLVGAAGEVTKDDKKLDAAETGALPIATSELQVHDTPDFVPVVFSGEQAPPTAVPAMDAKEQAAPADQGKVAGA